MVQSLTFGFLLILVFFLLLFLSFILSFKQMLKLARSITSDDRNYLNVNYNLFTIKKTSIYKAFLKPPCVNMWDLVRMQPTVQSHVLKWGKKILQGK